jgi:hypothetical protein
MRCWGRSSRIRTSMHSRLALVCCVMMTIDTCIHISVHIIHGLKSGYLSVDDLALHIEQLVRYLNVYGEGDRIADRGFRRFYPNRASSCSKAPGYLVTLSGNPQRKAHSINPTTTHSVEGYESSASIAVYTWSTIKSFVPKDTRSIHLMLSRRRFDQGYIGLGFACCLVSIHEQT